MTAAVMAAFGVTADLDTDSWRRLGVAPGQRYTGRVYHDRTGRLERLLLLRRGGGHRRPRARRWAWA